MVRIIVTNILSLKTMRTNQASHEKQKIGKNRKTKLNNELSNNDTRLNFLTFYAIIMSNGSTKRQRKVKMSIIPNVMQKSLFKSSDRIPSSWLSLI